MQHFQRTSWKSFDVFQCQPKKLPSVSYLSRWEKNHKLDLSFDGENFENASSSKCDHDLTYGLANYHGKALNTGSYYDSDCYVRTEIYDFGTNQWRYEADYPFAK